MLLAGKDKLKIWSAACSNGAEPYSLAIILDELTPGVNHVIDATDIDRKILQLAQQGYYKKDLLKNIPSKRVNKYFTQEGEGYYIKPEIKKMVRFKQHDLIKEKFSKGYDLIVCRNVTIYFTRETQNVLYQKFWEALNEGGVLFTGVTECILNHRELGYSAISPWFYQKISKENVI